MLTCGRLEAGWAATKKWKFEWDIFGDLQSLCNYLSDIPTSFGWKRKSRKSQVHEKRNVNFFVEKSVKLKGGNMSINFHEFLVFSYFEIFFTKFTIQNLLEHPVESIPLSFSGHNRGNASLVIFLLTFGSGSFGRAFWQWQLLDWGDLAHPETISKQGVNVRLHIKHTWYNS